MSGQECVGLRPKGLVLGPGPVVDTTGKDVSASGLSCSFGFRTETMVPLEVAVCSTSAEDKNLPPAKRRLSSVNSELLAAQR